MDIIVEAGSPWSGPVHTKILFAGSVLALGIHGVYTLVFGFLGMSLLVLTNGVLILWDLGALAALGKGWSKTVEIGSQILILGATALNTWWLGWDSGFYFYAVQLVPLVLLGFERPRIYRVGFTVLTAALLGALYGLSLVQGPVARVPREVLAWIYEGNLLVTLGTMAVMAGTLSKGVAAIALKLRETNRQLETIAYFDPLTGLLNRRALWDRLGSEVARTKRHHPGIVVCLADIDNFKQFNDDWGHDLGDRMLVHVARILKECLRQEDVASRWGGEEFLLVLTATDEIQAGQTLDRLRDQVAREPLDLGGKTHWVTLTLGYSAWVPGENPDVTIARADHNLLEGKRTGKNKVVGF